MVFWAFGGKPPIFYFSSFKGARGPVTWMSTMEEEERKRINKENVSQKLTNMIHLGKHWRAVFLFTHSQVGTRD